MRGRMLLYVCLPLLLAAFAGVSAAAAEREPAGYLALTFDDGPNAAATARLLDGLRARGVHATFFLIGEQIEGQEALVRRMREEGHQLGNHTWSHCRLDCTGAAGRRELERTEAELERVLDGSGYWVRPPWGFASEETLREAEVPLLYWSLDTEDWKLLDSERVYRRMVDEARDGDVILLHDAYATSVDAALRAVDSLQRRGFVFVTVEELFTHMGIEPEPGRLYSRPDRLRMELS